eukprot:g45166.t1
MCTQVQKYRSKWKVYNVTTYGVILVSSLGNLGLPAVNAADGEKSSSLTLWAHSNDAGLKPIAASTHWTSSQHCSGTTAAAMLLAMPSVLLSLHRTPKEHVAMAQNKREHAQRFKNTSVENLVQERKRRKENARVRQWPSGIIIGLLIQRL